MNIPMNTVLIIEDSHEDQRIYQRFLSRQPDFPCRILTADTGRDGLARMLAEEPTCVLLDYLLPDMDGLHFLATLKEQADLSPLPAIVMLTSQGNTSIAVKAMKYGIQDYLDKGSIKAERLIHTVTNATAHVALQRELHLQEQRLRERELQYRTLVEASIQGLYILQDAVIEFANPAMAALLGYDEPRELVGRHYAVTVAPDDRPRLEAYRRAQLEGESAPSQYEYQGLCKDGTRVWLECVVSPVSWGLGAALMVAFIDISARKQAEEDMLRARKIESVGVLAGGIAHDFNNLLTGILANVSMAKHLATEQASLVSRLSEAEKACQQAAALTQQLLTFSKGGAPVREPISVATLIRESVDFALHGAAVRAKFNMAPDLWPAHVDAGQMHQVIHNVVLNAAQAMPSGGVVSVRAGNVVLEPQSIPTLEAGRYIQLTVTDHGSGIPDHVRPNIFDPYYTTKEHGSGLGLSIAYAIVTKHDGHITVDSVPNSGSTFTIYLPTTTESIPSAPRPLYAQVSGRGHILALDDEDYILDLLHEMLDHMGYTVTCCRDGTEAIEAYQRAMAENRPIAAVILDITIPGGMGGYETFKHLCGLNPDLKAILSSGYTNSPLMANFAEYGFAGVIAKPYTVDKLQDVLFRVLSHASA